MAFSILVAQCVAQIVERLIFIIDRDSGLLDAWLHRPASQRTFEDTIERDTGKVICTLIPDPVRKLLQDYSSYNKQHIFKTVISMNLREGDSWDSIVQAITEAMEHTDKMAETIKQG